jgi:DNA invertase Pin-like site-specific DNA recombinase
MKPIVAYCRSANEPLDGPSTVRGQAHAIRRYAEERGLTLGAVYADAGVSGVTLERPELQRLLADCRGGQIGMIITKDPERLSRDKSQLIALLQLFREADVHVVFSTKGGEDSYQLFRLGLSALAELDEAKRRSKPNHRKRQ